MIILGTNSVKDSGYTVDNSCRFNDGDSPYMHKTPGSASGTRTKFTFNCWFKRGVLGTEQNLIEAGTSSNERTYLSLGVFGTNELSFVHRTGGSNSIVVTGTNLLRDVSAWYMITVKYDSTQGSANDRVRLYINGTEVAYTTQTMPGSNDTTYINDDEIHYISRANHAAERFLDGYLAEVCLIDASALAPTSFGEFDEDSPTIWKPIDVSGLTFGTNGFYLDFEDSSALGNDVSGNDNDFTLTDIAATDQATDTPTNNFSTINSLDNYFYAATLSEGNLVQTANAGNYSFGTSTFGVSSGKWVVEVKISTGSGGDERHVVGITDKVSTGTTDQLGDLANAWQYSANGYVYNSGSDIGDTYDTYTTDDIIGIYLDLDNNKLYFSKNGTVQNSGTGISITAPSSTTNGVYFIAFGDYGASDDSVNNVNFGSPPYANSSSVTDGDYGDFEYNTTITGDSASKTFKALCTKNLAEYG